MFETKFNKNYTIYKNLQIIKGIGPYKANLICNSLGINKNLLFSKLPQKHIENLFIFLTQIKKQTHTNFLLENSVFLNKNSNTDNEATTSLSSTCFQHAEFEKPSNILPTTSSLNTHNLLFLAKLRQTQNMPLWNKANNKITIPQNTEEENKKNNFLTEDKAEIEQRQKFSQHYRRFKHVSFIDNSLSIFNFKSAQKLIAFYNKKLHLFMEKQLKQTEHFTSQNKNIIKDQLIPTIIEDNLQEYNKTKIFKLININSYRGRRLKLGYPNRGQRTRSNGKTAHKKLHLYTRR